MDTMHSPYTPPTPTIHRTQATQTHLLYAALLPSLVHQAKPVALGVNVGLAPVVLPVALLTCMVQEGKCTAVAA